jgi:hypothetical protein
MITRRVSIQFSLEPQIRARGQKCVHLLVCVLASISPSSLPVPKLARNSPNRHKSLTPNKQVLQLVLLGASAYTYTEKAVVMRRGGVYPKPSLTADRAWCRSSLER